MTSGSDVTVVRGAPAGEHGVGSAGPPPRAADAHLREEPRRAQQPRPRIGQQPLLGQTAVVIGAADGMAAETARLARAAGGEVIVTDADAGDPSRVERVLGGLPEPVDHLVVSARRPPDAALTDSDSVRERRDVDEHLWVPFRVARAAVGRLRPGGTLLFLSSTASRPPGPAVSLVEALQVARRALITHLAAEISPIRVNLIGADLVDKPLSARLLGVTLVRGDDLRSTLPLARVVSPPDVAELAVHLMADPSVTGATYDLDGGGPHRAGGGSLL